jgi:transcriptional regulator with XRE-family HTH domain
MSIDGRQIKAARAILGLSQDALARACGVHRNTVTAIERSSENDWPSTARITEALNERGVTFDVQDGRAVVSLPVSGKSSEE